MPVYEYKCEECGTDLERFESLADPPGPPACTRKHFYTVMVQAPHPMAIEDQNPDPGFYMCPGKMKRMVSQSTFLLKGTGWYKDGY